MAGRAVRLGMEEAGFDRNRTGRFFFAKRRGAMQSFVVPGILI